MCYSAMVKKKKKQYEKETGVKINMRQFEMIFGFRAENPMVHIPRCVEDWFADPQGDEERRIKAYIDQHRAWRETKFQKEMFEQKQRVANALRSLENKETKKARKDVQVGTDKAAAAQAKIEDLKRTEPKTRDGRIFPFSYGPIIIEENGERELILARYHCRGNGKPASIDKERDGLFNARRDNLEGYWRKEFGKTHAIMLVDWFYEWVMRDKKVEIQFKPRDADGMIIACLYARWTDPKGVEPDLLSFAAITDEPPPEIKAAGHDRVIINLKPEHIDAWLTPKGRSAAELQAILGDIEKPYYENQLSAAA